MAFHEIYISRETSCWQRRTLLEKLLAVLVFLAVIAILALSISLYVLNVHSEREFD